MKKLLLLSLLGIPFAIQAIGEEQQNLGIIKNQIPLEEILAELPEADETNLSNAEWKNVAETFGEMLNRRTMMPQEPDSLAPQRYTDEGLHLLINLLNEGQFNIRISAGNKIVNLKLEPLSITTKEDKFMKDGFVTASASKSLAIHRKSFPEIELSKGSIKADGNTMQAMYQIAPEQPFGLNIIVKFTSKKVTDKK